MQSLRPPLTLALSLMLCLACQTTIGCDSAASPKRTPSIDADRAWAHLERQVAFGPRPSGSKEIEECRKFLEAELTGMGLAPKRETFEEKTPVGEIEFANVWAEWPGTDAKEGWIVLGSHYDTKRMPFPFVGANDAGSSTAALIEIARAIVKGGKSPFTYRFVFFDGEEATRNEWVDPDNTYGSRYHAQQLKRVGENTKARVFVLLDMVGDKDLKLTRDIYSDRKFMDVFVGAARMNGLGAYVDGRSLEVRDDHLSFMAIGVPSINLIDFEYGPNNSYWHTKDDVLANCSKESLAVIGKITLLGLEKVEELLRTR
ncbi:MAG: M28 family peptidase [Planctomycetota bacterium]|nr:M28 family peptidase [Planctomycetota bacterium]